MPCSPAIEALVRVEALFREASGCTACPRLIDRTPVLSALNGSLRPKVLFVAEAPGRRGADRTRIPMWGDASGTIFRHLLQHVGLRARDIFVTNAVLCNPRDGVGRNRAPTLAEIRNCSRFLEQTVELLDAPVIATVGGVALRALGLIEPHGLTLQNNAGTIVPWRQRLLVPLYHPSPRVLNTRRSLSQQQQDWQAVRYALEASGALPRDSSPSKGGSSERSLIPK